MVGADNILVGRRASRRAGATSGRVARGGFGLVHGFGFAYVLKEFGLPQAALGWSLFAFNLGVEFGQLELVVPLALGAGLSASTAGAAGRVPWRARSRLFLPGLYGLSNAYS